MIVSTAAFRTVQGTACSDLCIRLEQSGGAGAGGGRDAVSRGSTLAGKVHAPWVSLVFKSTSESHKTVVSGASSRCAGAWDEGRGLRRGGRASVKRQFILVMCLMKESVAAKNVLIRIDAHAPPRQHTHTHKQHKTLRRNNADTHTTNERIWCLLPLWVSCETAKAAKDCRAAKGPEERA